MSWVRLFFIACLLISTFSHLFPWIHVVLASGAAQKNQLSRDQLHRPRWFQGSLPRTGSPTSSCQLLWRATFQAPWQSSQVSGQHGTLSGKLSFWRRTRLTPLILCLKETQSSHLAANYSIALVFKLLLFLLFL